MTEPHLVKHFPDSRQIPRKNYQSAVPLRRAVMISPLISLLKGQHWRKVFMLDIRERHLRRCSSLDKCAG